MFGKNCSKKVPKNVFLYSHVYHAQKIGGKNTRNNFSRNKQIVRAKHVGSKYVSTKCEKTFIYSNEYSEQKAEGKTHEKFFRETHE